MNKLLFILLLGFGSMAQAINVNGIVTDVRNNESLVGVSILVYNPQNGEKTMVTGTSTDLDGSYKLDLQEGKYILKVSYVSYKQKEIVLDVRKGSVTVQRNIQLEEAPFLLESVEVVARASRDTEGVLLMDRKKATSIEEKIGSRELGKKAVSNAAAGVKKVVGVSMIGTSRLFVRGLGDRFNSTQLNSLPLASPDPNKKNIKLDIFQLDIIQNLAVKKAYSVENYADYTGALIDVSTKEYPEEGFLNFSMGGNYNTQSTFDRFMQIEASGNRFMGLDVHSRQNLTPDKYLVAKKKTQIIGSDFTPASYGFSDNNAMPFMNIAFSGGKLFEINEKRKIGGVFSVSFNNDYQSMLGVKELEVNKQNIADGDFISDKYAYNSYLTALGSLSYLHNHKNSINYNILFVNNGSDVFKEKTGTKPDWKSAQETALIRNAQYINYRMITNQLSGNHELKNESFHISWKLAYSLLQYRMPDRREVVYWTQQAMDAPAGEKEWGFMTYDKGLATKRLITNQNTNDFAASLVLDYQINEQTKLVVGGESRLQFLDYRSFFYGYDFYAGQTGNITLPVDISRPNDYFGSDYLDKVHNNTSDQMGYDGKSSIYAVFTDFNYSFSNKLFINAGIRMESSLMEVTPNMNVYDGDEQSISFQNLDLFPALNIKWAAKENMNLRFAASRTVTRPSFYEKSPALIIPEQGENRFLGNIGTKENPNDFGFYLENSYSKNAELKWEYFPSSREVIAVSAYGKILSEPIENISYIQGGTDRTYSVRNFSDNATVAGLEVEVKKKFKHLHTGFNMAYIYTHIQIPENANELNKTRALQGASPYVINADIAYEFNYGNDRKTYLGFIYNIYGKRLYVVGINEGNQYQLARGSLDMVLKNKLSEKFHVDLSLRNLLNDKYTIVQDVYENENQPEVKTRDVVIHEYTSGINFSISLKYNL